MVNTLLLYCQPLVMERKKLVKPGQVDVAKKTQFNMQLNH